MIEREGGPSPDDGREEAATSDGDGGVERTAATVVVAASTEKIMQVIADFAEYPSWVESVRSAEVLTVGGDGRPGRVRFELDAGIVTDTYILEYSWSADGRSVQWVLVESVLQRKQLGSYLLTPVDGGTEVAYRLEVELTVPTIGRVRDRAARRIVGAALSDLRRRVESGTDPGDGR